MRGRERRFRVPEDQTVWFKMSDGEVDFVDPKERWFLAGRKIESFECM